jgi:hypothetical protein
MAHLTYICMDTSRQIYTSNNTRHPHVLSMHHQWNTPVYSAKTQYVEDKEDSPDLSPKDVNRLQQLKGTLLFYGIAVDPTLIIPVNVLASEQTRETADTANKIINLLNYCTTHPEATLR